MTSYKQVVDSDKIGKKGTPRFPEAFGMPLPTKQVKVENEEREEWAAQILSPSSQQ